MWGLLSTPADDVFKEFSIGRRKEQNPQYWAIMPSVACNGNDYLVVWSDIRSMREGSIPPPADLTPLVDTLVGDEKRASPEINDGRFIARIRTGVDGEAS